MGKFEDRPAFKNNSVLRTTICKVIDCMGKKCAGEFAAGALNAANSRDAQTMYDYIGATTNAAIIGAMGTGVTANTNTCPCRVCKTKSGNGRYCRFPFTYKNGIFHQCTTKG